MALSTICPFHVNKIYRKTSWNHSIAGGPSGIFRCFSQLHVNVSIWNFFELRKCRRKASGFGRTSTGLINIACNESKCLICKVMLKTFWRVNTSLRQNYAQFLQHAVMWKKSTCKTFIFRILALWLINLLIWISWQFDLLNCDPFDKRKLKKVLVLLLSKYRMY